MKLFRALMLVFVWLIVSGCSNYPDITGKVVYNATGKPIEGALVVAQWTKKHGYGLTYHTLSKITETLTDKNGAFALSGIKDSFVEPPEMIIYKEGYIPWRNDSVFPSSNLTKNNEWNNNVTYKLDVFTEKYTAKQLADFIDYGMTIGMGLSDSVKFTEIANKLSEKRTNEIEWLKLKDKKQ